MKRTKNLIEFAKLVDHLVTGFNEADGTSYRVRRIDSPTFGGPVEIVIQDKYKADNLKAFTIREDGSATGLSFWQEGQI